MLPIWASGLSSLRAIIYSVFFVALTFLVSFSRFQFSSPLAGVTGLVFGCLSLWIERASFINVPIRIIIAIWLVLLMLIVSKQKLRRVVASNILVFAVLLLFLEIPLRLLTSSQSSSQFQYIELFRNSTSDGPGAQMQPVLSMDAKGLRVTTDQPSAHSGRVLIFCGSTTFCGEVSDRLTFPSALQRMLNDRILAC